MEDILRGENINPQKKLKKFVSFNVNKLVAFYGLNPVIKFCQRCTCAIKNQTQKKV